MFELFTSAPGQAVELKWMPAQPLRGMLEGGTWGKIFYKIFTITVKAA